MRAFGRAVKDIGPLWHALGGASIAAAATVIGIPAWLSLPVVALGGWLREVVQHDFRLSAWQWLEAAAWAIGAVAGFAGVLLAAWAL